MNMFIVRTQGNDLVIVRALGEIAAGMQIGGSVRAKAMKILGDVTVRTAV
jgi:hypothetical protein